MEIVFAVTQEADGGYVAECLTHDIYTQADSWEELRRNVQEVVAAFFFDQPKPCRIRLHLVRNEVLGNRMKLPRDLSGAALIQCLCASFNYRRR